MADLIIKPTAGSGNKLIFKDQAGNPIITTADSGGTIDSGVTWTSPVISTGISGSAVLDSDTMSGVSATKISTSESIKAYVDTADALKAPLASPTLVTPALGTPTQGVMTNMTGAVTASIVDNAVTLAKMAGGTDGNLITYDTSGDPAYVATGASGAVLTSAGADAVPTFQALDLGTSVTAVADGAIADGDKVIMQTDGTVKVALGVSTSLAAASPGVLMAFTGSQLSSDVCYHPPTGKFLIVYRGTSGHGTMVVATLSGTTVTMGTPVVFRSASFVQNTINCAYDPDKEMILISGNDEGQSDKGMSWYADINSSTYVPSAGSYSYITPSNYFTYGGDPPSMAYDKSKGKWVVLYREQNGGAWSGYVGHILMANLGTPSAGAGTSMTWESAVQVNALQTGPYTQHSNVVYDESAERLIIAFRNPGNSDKGEAKVCTISGTTLTFGTGVNFSGTDAIESIACSYDPGSGKTLFAWEDFTGSNGKCCMATISGGVISFGSVQTFTSAGRPDFLEISYDPIMKIHVGFYKLGNPAGKSMLTTFKVSTSGALTIDATLEVDPTTSAEYIGVSGGPGGVIATGRFDGDNRAYGITLKGVIGNVKLNNFLGISDGAYADTVTATIQTSGSTDDAQSGLTIGSTYFLQGTGAISTTPETNFDAPIMVGTALTATTLLIKG